MRKLGQRVVNFPLPGTGEVQAIPRQSDIFALQRAARAAKRGRAPDARPAHAMPVWGSGAVRSVHEPKRHRMSSAVLEAPLAPAATALPATPAGLRAPVSRLAFSPPETVPLPLSSAEGAADATELTPPKFVAAVAAAADPSGSTSGELTAFLRGISPPLASADAAVAAARAAGLTMQHLRCAAEKIKRPEFAYKPTLDFLGASLGLQSGADHFALLLALQSLS